jgi:polynucleotide 5'-hydroxyl-kinase GRC3/NOL9
MLLDFDFDMPELTPSGMMAVSRIKEPLLGPSFTHPANPSDIIKMHFVGGLGKRTSISQLAEQIKDLVQTARIHLTESVPVVIRLPAWLASTMGDTLENIWETLGITALVQTDDSPLDVLKVLVGHYGASNVRLESRSFDSRIGTSDDREIRTRTYFHAAPSSPGRRYWTDTALAATPNTRKTLKFGSSKGTFAALVLLDRLIALEDTCEAVAGGIGAIVSASRIYFDSSIRPHVQHEPDGLPRLKSSWQFALPPSQSCCMGLAYVAEVRTETLEVVVSTPVPDDQMGASEDRIYLLVLPGRRNGWLSSAFIADELEAVGQG